MCFNKHIWRYLWHKLETIEALNPSDLSTKLNKLAKYATKYGEEQIVETCDGTEELINLVDLPGDFHLNLIQSED